MLLNRYKFVFAVLLLTTSSFAAVEQGQSRSSSEAQSSSEESGINLRTNLFVPLLSLLNTSGGFGGTLSVDFKLDENWTLGPSLFLGNTSSTPRSMTADTLSPLKKSQDDWWLGVASNYSFNSLSSKSGSAFIRGELLLTLSREYLNSADGTYKEKSVARPGLLSTLTAGYQWGLGKGLNFSLAGGIGYFLVQPFTELSFSERVISSSKTNVIPWLSADIGWRF
ncbi:hypothetical protein K2X30_11225 [bacterium]|nr:hypothetical protein [bacterium]